MPDDVDPELGLDLELAVGPEGTADPDVGVAPEAFDVGDPLGAGVNGARISAIGTPPERRTASKTLTCSPCSTTSCLLSEVDAPPNPAAVPFIRKASHRADNRALSSGIGSRVGRPGMRGASSSSRTRHPDTTVTEPAISATSSDLRDQADGIRSFAGMGSMMA